MRDHFLKYIQLQKRYSPNTVTAYETDLAQFQDYLNSEYDAMPSQEATHGIIRSWIVKQVEEGMDAASVNRKIACLRSYYKFLLREELIHRDPMMKIKILKTKKKLPHFVPEQEIVQTLDAELTGDPFEQERDRLVLELLYGTGMRLSELIGLRDKDINLRDRTLKVLGKRNKERVIPFTTTLQAQFVRYRDERNRQIERKDDHFLVLRSGEPLYPVFVNRLVKKFLKEANVEKKSPHVLRHTYATHLLDKGAEINAVKDLLGHTSLAATQVYTHNSLEKLKKVFDQAHSKA